MFVVSLNYKVPLTEIDRLAPGHIEWLEACYAEGIFVASGPKRPRTGGIIIARCPREVLDARLAADPFAQAGAADYDITEFTARMTAAGLGSFKEA
ncbi:YciI family protein [Mesorhizobium sp. B3-2-1]|uniref:YciI family protein n=1 Tax=unclassified Mesorhizobium TaxID=325217 RepID=UPI0011271D29|nr:MULTISPECIES: YciI family protein [unclassified Mesorhizobium]MBZ9670518.1 YciI family protein [Mesorhizobium sp. ES1-3]TPI31714.1 YciI family protein [Mesorhizobium sp. B3-2-1]